MSRADRSDRPDPSEHLPYYEKYISLLPPGDVLATLGPGDTFGEEHISIGTRTGMLVDFPLPGRMLRFDISLRYGS